MTAGRTQTVVVALLAVLAVLIVAACCAAAAARGGGRGPATAATTAKDSFANWGSHWGPSLAAGYPYNYQLAEADPEAVELNRFYSTAEVDPVVAGRLYQGPRGAGTGRRWIYGGRTAPGQTWGLHEFSEGVPGEPGVDVGLLGMREYSLDGKPGVFDDGIPAEWLLPSTPVNWYAPRAADYYDVEDQQVRAYGAGDIEPLSEPDHDPPLN